MSPFLPEFTISHRARSCLGSSRIGIALDTLLPFIGAGLVTTPEPVFRGRVGESQELGIRSASPFYISFETQEGALAGFKVIL